MIMIRGLAKSNINDRLSVKECYHRCLSELDNKNNYGVINDDNNFDLDVITYLKFSTTSINSTLLLLILEILLTLLKNHE